MYEVLNKIKRKWMNLRMQPIRVFCFHHVSAVYDPDVYCKPDWIPLDFLKNYLEQLQAEGYKFISLAEAQTKIANDKFRIGKYAVLTADDGLKCQLALVPWLEERHIPITLFVNLETLDGETCGVEVKKYFNIKDRQTEKSHARELYLTGDDLNTLSPMVSIGMHGVTHDSIDQYTDEEFAHKVETCVNALKEYPNYVPFYAYTYGIRTAKSNDILRSRSVIPVYADGQYNNNSSVIHREVMEYIYNSQNVGDK